MADYTFDWNSDKEMTVEQFQSLLKWVKDAGLSRAEKKLALKLLRSQFNRMVKDL